MVPKHQPVIYHATVHDIFRRSSQWSGCTMLHLPNCCQRKPRHPRKPSQVLLGDSSRNLRLINFLPKTCRRPKGHVVRTLGFKTCALHIYNICTVYIYINYMGEKNMPRTWNTQVYGWMICLCLRILGIVHWFGGGVDMQLWNQPSQQLRN